MQIKSLAVGLAPNSLAGAGNMVSRLLSHSKLTRISNVRGITTRGFIPHSLCSVDLK